MMPMACIRWKRKKPEAEESVCNAKYQRGCAPPTRFESIHGTVGDGNSRCCFVTLYVSYLFTGQGGIELTNPGPLKMCAQYLHVQCQRTGE